MTNDQRDVSTGAASGIQPEAEQDHRQFLLAAIVESSDDAIISKSLNGIITSWNRAAEQIFGYTSEEMVGQSILRVIPEDLHAEEGEILRKLQAGQRIEHYETVRVTKSGERIDVSLTISPVRDASGKVIGASKISQDISKRKQMERVLLQAEKVAAVGRMAATIAHEINNPLEAVLNLVFLARSSASASEEVRRYLETAEREIERVSRIAKQTLAYYRDTDTTVELSIENLLDEVLFLYETKLRALSIRVEKQFAAARDIQVAKGELIQIFSNLIANAIDAMPQGGVLSLTVREVAREGREGIEIVVQDNGCGIEQESISRIFEPFFTTKKDMGNGIGLWIAKQFVDTHHGHIEVESSTRQGTAGTRFSVFMPFRDSDRGSAQNASNGGRQENHWKRAG